jgi:hypothetical protein
LTLAGVRNSPCFFLFYVLFLYLSFTKGHRIITDMEENWDTYLDCLRKLPFVENVSIREVNPQTPNQKTTKYRDAILDVETSRGTHEFWVELKKTHLTYALADGLIAQAGRADHPLILFAISVPRQIGRYLGERGINYVDQAGNCRLQIDTDFMAVIEGQTPIKQPAAGRGISIPGYRVLFTILTQPKLLNSPVRTLAEASAVSKTTAAETIARLVQEELVSPIQGRRSVLNPKALLERWMLGYETLRPRMLMGRFRTQDADPSALEKRVEKELGKSLVWAWGGGSAAMRITKHYRGEETVLHVSDPANDLPRRLRALPAVDGPLIIQRTPNKTAFEGIEPHTVHPLLVFADLMVNTNSRAREVALEIRQRFIKI